MDGVPNAGMFVNLPQHTSDAGTFHVQESSLEGRSAAGEEGAAALLKNVQNAHASRADVHA